MQLLVKGLDGHHSCFSSAGWASVADLKLHIEAVHGIPSNEQLLTANGRILQNASTLFNCGLQQGSTVHLLLRLCGGKGGFGALLRGQGRDGKITDNFDAMRDLSGRRIRHVEAEKKLQQWQQDAKERELEQLALKHMKELAKQAKRERDFQINVEEVKREHKQAADAVVEAVHAALAQGLQQEAGPSSKHTGAAQAASSPDAAGVSEANASGTSSGEEAAASPGNKRKAASTAVDKEATAPAKRRKKTMLDMLDGGSDDGSGSDDEQE